MNNPYDPDVGGVGAHVLEQYKVLAARREAHNTRLWQIPALAILGQAFFVKSALVDVEAAELQATFAALAFAVGIATLLLMAKFRHLEVGDSKKLHKWERKFGYHRLHRRPKVRKFLDWLSAFWVWAFVLAVLCAFSARILMTALGRIP